MSRAAAALLSLILIAAADTGPLPHAAGTPDGAGPRCGGGFTAARGDTLYSIARRCGVTVAELVEGNGLGHPPRLAAGQRIELGIEVDMSRRGTFPSPRPDRVPGPPPPSAVRPLPPVAPQASTNVYRFQAGDTLYSLARWARTSLAALRAANPGLDPADIEIGTPIALPRGAVRPEPMRLRERGGTVPVPAMRPPPPPPAAPPPVPRTRPAPPSVDDEADKPKPDDEDTDDADDGPTPGGIDDGGPEPDGM
jgi:LysM repeat protein